MITMLHVIEALEDFGGTPRKMLYLARHLDLKRGRLVFACFKPSPLASEFLKYQASVFSINTNSPIQLGMKIARLAKEIHADVICTHFTRSLLSGFIAAKKRRLPIIHNEHSPPHVLGAKGILTRTCLFPLVNRIICNSFFTRKSVELIYPWSPGKLYVIHNPVQKRMANLDRHASRRNLSVGQSEILIGHIGGLISSRDQETLIRGFSIVHKEFPNAKLLIVGDGPERERLKSLGMSQNLGEHIHFIGYSNQVGNFLNALDIYVNPALSEGFGIAVVEAMLAGLPVVLADKGAHPELIRDGASGLFYRGGDPQRLAEKIKWLILHPCERKEIGVGARSRAWSLFGPARYAEEYLSTVEAVRESTRSSAL